MTAPSTQKVDRGSWIFYAGSGLLVLASLPIARAGQWSVVVLVLAVAAHIAAHPHLRRQWYRIGWNDGYVDGYLDEEGDRLRLGRGGADEGGQ